MSKIYGENGSLFFKLDCDTFLWLTLSHGYNMMSLNSCYTQMLLFDIFVESRRLCKKDAHS